MLVKQIKLGHYESILKLISIFAFCCHHGTAVSCEYQKHMIECSSRCNRKLVVERLSAEYHLSINGQIKEDEKHNQMETY